MVKRGLEEYSKIKEINLVIESNIFGVDINDESVEITKLSLFLKLAGPNSKLAYLSNNIKKGNSLINDRSADKNSAFVWEKQFPDFFYDPKLKNSEKELHLTKKLEDGFDIIIGNPPYERTLYLEEEKEYYAKNYESAYGGYDILVLFFELGLKLLKNSGLLGFIVSNKFLVSDYGKKIRKIITEQSKIQTIVDLADAKRIFPDALVSPVIIILKKSKPELDYNIRRLIASKSTSSFINEDFNNISINNFVARNGTFNVRYTIGKESIYQKIYKLKKFGDDNMFDVRTGIMGFEYWKMEPSVTDGEVSKKDIRIATNSCIDQYCFLWGKTVNIYKKKFIEPYVNYDTMPINQNTKKLFLTKNKIIVRGVAQRLTGVLDDMGIGFLVAVHSIITNDDYDTKFILALINSKFYNWIHKDRFYLGRIPEGSLKYPVSFLKELPLPKISRVKQKPFIEMSEIMIKGSTDVHNMTMKFLKTISAKFSISKTSEKLNLFYEMNFSDFIKEIKKISKKKLTLLDIEDIEDYFTKNKNEITMIKNNLFETQTKLDGMIYALFELDTLEISFIENELAN